MAEGTYDYECMRAELLGLEKPDLETFERNRKQQEVNEEEQTNAELQVQNYIRKSSSKNKNVLYSRK